MITPPPLLGWPNAVEGQRAALVVVFGRDPVGGTNSVRDADFIHQAAILVISACVHSEPPTVWVPTEGSYVGPRRGTIDIKSFGCHVVGIPDVMPGIGTNGLRGRKSIPAIDRPARGNQKILVSASRWMSGDEGSITCR